MEWQKRMLKNCDFCTKKKQPGATVIADSRLLVLFFSDVLESH